MVGLTQRQIQILELIAEGFNTDEISKYLFITSNTTRTHIRKMMEKTDTNNRASLVAWGFRRGLLN